MDRRDQVEQILAQIRSQLEELLDEPGVEELTPEELVVLAAEMTVGLPITTQTFGQPIGEVLRDQVWFMIDEDSAFPLFKEDEDDTT